MSPPTDVSRIAVLDIGKTNLKLLVATDDGWPLESHSIPNVAVASDRYLAYDLARLEEWFLGTLAEVARRHAIGAVISTAHGCGAVLVNGNTPVLPMMDYDAVSPPAIDEAYARIAPPYCEVFCGIGAGAIRLAKQLLWQAGAALTVIVWDAVMTFVILKVLSLFIKLRLPDPVLETGDLAVHDEEAYPSEDLVAAAGAVAAPASAGTPAPAPRTALISSACRGRSRMQAVISDIGTPLALAMADRTSAAGLSRSMMPSG